MMKQFFKSEENILDWYLKNPRGNTMWNIRVPDRVKSVDVLKPSTRMRKNNVMDGQYTRDNVGIV